MALEATLEEFQKPHKVFGPNDYPKMERVVELLKSFMKTRLVKFITDRSLMPIAVFYSSDCTPLCTQKRYRLSDKGRKVVRHAMQTVEWLCQRFYAQDARGNVKVMVTEPWPMGTKDAWAHYQAFAQAIALPKELGHRSVCVHHHVWDRAIFSACDRHQRQRHRQYFEELRHNIEPSEAKMQELLSWYTAEACKCHDIHNGLKASVLSYINDKETTKALFIVIESLRRGYDVLVKSIKPWLHLNLRFQDWAFPEMRSLWLLLGVSQEWVDVLEDMQLRYEAPYIKVAQKYQEADPEELFSRLEMVLLALFSFKRFTESRWCTLGPSARTLMAAVCGGLEGLHAFIMLQDELSKFYIGGFSRFKGKVRRMVALLATSSHGVDCLLARFMADDRLVKVMDIAKKELWDEVQYVCMVDDSVWKHLAERVGVPMWELRHEALNAAWTAAGFALGRCRAVNKLPWTLCAGGDYDKNLCELEEQEQPLEETSSKIWALLHLDFDRAQLRDGLALMANCSWSSNNVEQGHASASTYMKLHKHVGENRLQLGSFIIQAAQLALPSPAERQLKRLRSRLERLGEYKEQYFSARNAYVQQVMREAKSRSATAKFGSIGVARELLKGHAAAWRALSREQQAMFRNKAQALRAQKVSEKDGMKASLSLKIQELEAKSSLTLIDGLPQMRLGAAKWSVAERLELEELYARNDLSREEVQHHRARAKERVVGPPVPVRQALDAIKVFARDSNLGPPPRWAKGVALNREFFVNTILRFSDGFAVEYCKVVYCVQSPIMVCVCKVERCADDGVELDRFFNAQPKHWNHTFLALFDSFAWTDDGDFGDEWSVDVLTDVLWLAEGMLVSDSVWRPLEDVLDWFSAEVAAPVVAPEPVVPEEEPATPQWTDVPWLLEEQVWEGERVKAEKVTQEVDEDIFAAVAAEAEGVDPEALWDALVAAREALEATTPELYPDFMWVVRGGQWLMQSKGLGYDSLRGQAKGALAQKWCAMYNLTGTATFAVRAYTEPVAQQFAIEWCARRQYFFDAWKDAGCQDNWAYPEAVLDGCPERPDFTAAVASATGQTLVRATALRAERPRGGHDERCT